MRCGIIVGGHVGIPPLITLWAAILMASAILDRLERIATFAETLTEEFDPESMAENGTEEGTEDGEKVGADDGAVFEPLVIFIVGELGVEGAKRFFGWGEWWSVMVERVAREQREAIQNYRLGVHRWEQLTGKRKPRLRPRFRG